MQAKKEIRKKNLSQCCNISLLKSSTITRCDGLCGFNFNPNMDGVVISKNRLFHSQSQNRAVIEQPQGESLV